MLSILQQSLLRYTEQYYWRRGSLPTYALIENEFKGENVPLTLTEEDYNAAWEDPVFRKALVGRGIPERLVLATGGLEGRLLSEKQLTVANTMVDVLDKRSRLKKLTELGVSTSEYNLWLRDPIYRAYCLERAEELLESNQHVAHLSLIDRVTQGDLGAIKYFNSLTGRYREKQSAAVQVNNLMMGNSEMLIKVVEVIQRHVKDPKILEAIGNDILELTHVMQAPVEREPHWLEDNKSLVITTGQNRPI